MPGDASGPAPAITRVAARLRQAIASGAIPPGEQIRLGCPGWPCGLGGTAARAALAIVRREGLAHWHRYGYYAAPAGPPLQAVNIRLGRVLTEVRAAVGVTVGGLAARIADGDGPWESGGRDLVIGLRIADITAAENGTGKPS
jgi:DNA-binding GntR family transcriptional regulator